MSTTTAWTIPGAASGSSWTSPNNAKAEDGAEATSDGYSSVTNPGDPTEYNPTSPISLGTYGFSLGASDTPRGIEVQVKCRRTGTGTCNVRAYLAKSGAAVGSVKNLGNASTGGLAFVSGGGAADLWGATWTPAEINGSLEVVVYGMPTSSPSSAGNLIVDSVQVRVTSDDTTPNAFAFSDVTNQPLSTLVTSNSVVISGMDVDIEVPVTVTNGEWEKNSSGSWSSAAGTAENGDSLRVRHTTSGAYNTTVNTTLNVNGVSDIYSSTTLVQDTTPDAFTFTDEFFAEPSSQHFSNRITPTGINAPTAWSRSGGDGLYFNDSVLITALNGTLNPGDYFSAVITTAAAFSNASNMDVTVGGVTDTYSVTTRAADTTPNAFAFTDVGNSPTNTLNTSNVIVISGIEAAAAVSFSNNGNGTVVAPAATAYEYRKNGGAWANAAGSPTTVNNGDTLQVRLGSNGATSVTASLTMTVGGVADTYDVVTSEPAGFTFGSSSVQPHELLVSPSVQITGMGASYVGGITAGCEYSINGGAWTTAAAISNNDFVRVRGVSKGPGKTNTITLTINGVAGSWIQTSRKSLIMWEDMI